MIPPIKERFTNGKKNNSRRRFCQWWLRISVNLLLLSLFLSHQAFAQVVNDNISERSSLTLDAAPVFSTTDQSTVEWACINKKLTQKCLIYHNDQWFTFTPPQAGTFYLNVSNQECRKKFGVQVLLIEGNPCETSTYKLLHCESFTNQSDTFIRLDSLQANKSYLINIDGFLGDICGFEIQVATKPKGLPLKANSLDTLNFALRLNENIVTLQWTVDEGLLDSLDYIEVYKQASGDFKNRLLSVIPLQYNALGKVLNEYSKVDTLTKPDTYTYSLIGVFHNNHNRILLDQEKIGFWPRYAVEEKKRYLASVLLDYTKKADIDFLVMNAATDEVLFKRTCTACSNEVVDLDVTSEVLRGVFRFRIELYNTKTKVLKQMIFLLNRKGELVLKNATAEE